MMVNCATQPMMTSFGRLKTILKSSNLSAMPMPNMMTPSSGLMTVGLMPLNALGTTSATTAAASTSTPI